MARGRASERLDRTLRATAGLAFLLSVAIAAVYLVGGHTIISELFGEKYEDGYTVLLILSVGPGRADVRGVVRLRADDDRPSTRLRVDPRGQHRDHRRARRRRGPLWGLEGIALATAVSLSVQNFVQAAVLQRLTGLHSIADLRIAFSEGAGTLRR